MRNNRGTWTMADMLYWLFYLPMTFIVMFALVFKPIDILSAGVNPSQLDAYIFQERTKEHLAQYSPITGVDYTRLTSDPREATAYRLSRKQFAFKLDITGYDTIYGNKDFYELAMPLAPIKYEQYEHTYNIPAESGDKTVTLNQVYPKRYET